MNLKIKVLEKKTIVVILLIFFSAISFAQNKKIVTGVVKDPTGIPLFGVNVLEKGTNNYAVTDLDGEFNIEVLSNAIVVFNYIGFSNKEVSVENQGKFDIVLQESRENLDEVVVIGYGKARKKEITSSISTVKGEEIQKMTVGNAAVALQGLSSGVQVVNSGGGPGSSPDIIIRGITTFNNDKSPLLVVDGVMLPSGTNLNFLNPEDIQDMQILKDASAAAIYGSRASNGVIQITTKRGKTGKSAFTVDISSGVNTLQKIKMAGAQEYASVVNQRRINDGSPVKFSPEQIAAFGSGTDWWDATLNDVAPVQNYNIGISGGTEKLKYLASIGFYDEQSIYDKGYRKKITTRFNVDYNISDKLTLKQDLSPRFEKWENTPNLFYNILRMEPTTNVFLPLEEQDGRNQYSIFESSTIGVPNPVAAVARSFGGFDFFALFTNTRLNYKPIKGLNIESQFGLNVSINQTDSFSPTFYIDNNSQNLINSVSRSMSTNLDWVSNNTVTYSKKIGDHDFTFTGGLIYDSQTYNNLSGYRQDVPAQENENLWYLDAATGDNMSVGGGESVRTMTSYLGRLMYNFKDRYFLAAAVRRDGSSVFSEANRWGTFPSISVGWAISEEKFFKTTFINSLKFKAGYGQLGNQNINPDSRFFQIGDSNYVFGGDRVVTNVLSKFGNENLKWETVEDINLGIEGSLFNNHFNFSIEKYERASKDLLFQVEPPNYTGIPGTIAQNVGSMKSSGWDISLGYNNNIGAFKYSVSGNFSTNESKLDEIAPGIEELFGQQRSDLGNRYLKISRPGEIAGLFYGFETDGIFQNQTEVNSHSNDEGKIIQPNALPGDLRYVDKNKDGVIDDSDLAVIGNPFPNFTAGLNFNFSYHNWDLSMQWYGVFGNDVLNYSNLFMYSGINDVNVSKGALNKTWSSTNTDAKFPRLSQLDRNQNYQKPSDLFIEDGTYARLKLLQVGYNIPLKGVNKMRVSFSAQNVFTITKYSGFNPESSAGGNIIQGYGVDYANYPLSRSFLLGLNLSL